MKIIVTNLNRTNLTKILHTVPLIKEERSIAVKINIYDLISDIKSKVKLIYRLFIINAF